jgi:hypothetical protein
MLFSRNQVGWVLCERRGGIQDFKLGGGALKKNFWGISCEKSRFYAKKSYLFQF